MRYGLLAVSLICALGCGGVFNQVSDLVLEQGDEATHPEDFPVSPPEGGTLARSISLPMGDTETMTLQYDLAEGTDLDALLKTYEAELVDLGAEPVREGQQVAAMLMDGGMITISATGDASLSLVLMGAPAD